MYIGFPNHKKVNNCNIFFNIARISLKYSIIFIFFAFLFFMSNNANFCGYSVAESASSDIEQDLQDSTVKILNDIDFTSLEVLFENSEIDYSLFNGRTFKEYVKAVIEGEDDVGIDTFFSLIIQKIKNFISQIITPFSVILLIILLAALFNNLRGNKITGVSEIVFLICYAGVVLISSYLISGLIVSAKNNIVNMQKQMDLIFPILITLMTASGGVASVGAFSPLITFLSLLVSKIFIYVLFPIFTLSLVLSIIGNISKNVTLDKFNAFLKSCFKWIIGTTCAIFMAFLSVKSIIAVSKDGMTIKATKYAIKNYIPMLGGYISEGFELVKAGGLIVKNAVGFVGVILIIYSSVSVILSIAIIQICFKLFAGVIEPMGDKKSSKLLFDIAENLKLLVVIIIGIALMYFFTIYLMICSLSGVA